MAKRNQHVVPRGDQWAVQSAGGDRATRIVDTQNQAVRIARDIARNQRAELIVHGEDGKIRWRDSHGNDPFPPRG